VGASTKAKKISPPIQTTSDSNITKRRNDIAENYILTVIFSEESRTFMPELLDDELRRARQLHVPSFLIRPQLTFPRTRSGISRDKL
jgi:hypothetical protein